MNPIVPDPSVLAEIPDSLIHQWLVAKLDWLRRETGLNITQLFTFAYKHGDQDEFQADWNLSARRAGDGAMVNAFTQPDLGAAVAELRREIKTPAQLASDKRAEAAKLLAEAERLEAVGTGSTPSQTSPTKTQMGTGMEPVPTFFSVRPCQPAWR